MFRVCTHIESGGSENEWDYVLSNFAPDELYLIECGYQPTNNMMRDIQLMKSCDELPNVPIVLLAPTSMRNFDPETNLNEFSHPEDAIYLFGANNQHITQETFGNRSPDYIVTIPNDTHDEMFNHVAYAITAWHRRYG